MVIVNNGVGVPLLVTVQLIKSPAWAVKEIGKMVIADTSVPTGLLFVHEIVLA